MIPFLCQILVELVYATVVILNKIFGGEHAKFIMRFLFCLNRYIILANATLKCGKYTDLHQYSLTVSEGMLF